ncbi:flagellar hook-length control protein FliK [Advenella faeciporci]|nr:flagellar hook-length control protein FliK [Advenella faeciporci]
MTTISNNLSANNFSKNNAAGSNNADSANNTFSGILAMQAPASSQYKPSPASSATQNTTENGKVTAQAASKEPVAQNNRASGKTENDGSTAENKASVNDDAAQANKAAAPNENTADAENRTTPENGPNAAQTPSEALPVNVLAEHAILQQGISEAGVNAGDMGKPSLENTLLSQLIEPQRNLASRLSGKNPAHAELEAQTAAGSLAPSAKDRLAGSGKEKPDTLSSTENTMLTASQLAALDKQNAAGRAVNLTANKEATSQIREARLGRLSQEAVTPNLADPRNFNHQTPAQPLANPASDTLPDATVATHANANANPAVGTLAASNQAQASASPLISIGTSFYHPGWSQAMSQQLATQASLFFRQQANGTHIAQMRLDPPELGPIKVSVSIQDGVAQAAFVASNAAVRQALENSLADLHQALQEKGLSLGQAHVGQQDRRDGFLMEDDNAPGTAGQTKGSTGILADAGVPATGPSRQHDGLINTFA